MMITETWLKKNGLHGEALSWFKRDIGSMSPEDLANVKCQQHSDMWEIQDLVMNYVLCPEVDTNRYIKVDQQGLIYIRDDIGDLIAVETDTS